MHLQAAVLLARRARGRRRDFYRCAALQIAAITKPWSRNRLTCARPAGPSTRLAASGRRLLGTHALVGSSWPCTSSNRRCVGLPPPRHTDLRAEGHDHANLRGVWCDRPDRAADLDARWPTASPLRPLRRRARPSCQCRVLRWRRTHEDLDRRIQDHRTRGAGLIEQHQGTRRGTKARRRRQASRQPCVRAQPIRRR